MVVSFFLVVGQLVIFESFIEFFFKIVVVRVVVLVFLSNMVFVFFQFMQQNQDFEVFVQFKVLFSVILVVGVLLVIVMIIVVFLVLLVLSVFQQIVIRFLDFERKVSFFFFLIIGMLESQRKFFIIFSKFQFQDILIYFIKNDFSFFSIFYEVYLQVLIKNKDNYNL